MVFRSLVLGLFFAPLALTYPISFEVMTAHLGELFENQPNATTHAYEELNVWQRYQTACTVNGDILPYSQEDFFPKYPHPTTQEYELWGRARKIAEENTARAIPPSVKVIFLQQASCADRPFITTLLDRFELYDADGGMLLLDKNEFSVLKEVHYAKPFIRPQSYFNLAIITVMHKASQQPFIFSSITLPELDFDDGDLIRHEMNWASIAAYYARFIAEKIEETKAEFPTAKVIIGASMGALPENACARFTALENASLILHRTFEYTSITSCSNDNFFRETDYFFTDHHEKKPTKNPLKWLLGYFWPNYSFHTNPPTLFGDFNPATHCSNHLFLRMKIMLDR